MSILKKLFGGQKAKVEHQQLWGSEPIQSDAERGATRDKMEAEMLADKERHATPEAEAGKQ